jgi:hypothetical protein
MSTSTNVTRLKSPLARTITSDRHLQLELEVAGVEVDGGVDIVDI